MNLSGRFVTTTTTTTTKAIHQKNSFYAMTKIFLFEHVFNFHRRSSLHFIQISKLLIKTLCV